MIAGRSQRTGGGGRRLALALALGATLLAGCPDGAEDHLERAERLAFDNAHAKALEEVKATLVALQGRVDEESRALRVRALLLGGRQAQLFLHRPKEALAYYRALVEADPSSEAAFEARKNMARIHILDLDDLPGAIAHYQALVAGFPDHPEVDAYQYEVARGYLTLGDYDQVRTEARKLAERWPKSEYLDDARFLVGVAYHAEGRLDDAIRVFREVWETWPDSELAPRARVEAADCLVESGRNAEALEDYVAALPRHPDPKIVQMKIERLRVRMQRRRP